MTPRGGGMGCPAYPREADYRALQIAALTADEAVDHCGLSDVEPTDVHIPRQLGDASAPRRESVD